MLFRPKNAPSFYTIIMQFLRDDWNILFNETRNTISLVQSLSKIICDDHITIDDILLFLTTSRLFYIISCVTQIFTKYRLSFKVSKSHFLKDRIEYVGHVLATNGNCPAASKFSLLQD